MPLPPIPSVIVSQISCCVKLWGALSPASSAEGSSLSDVCSDALERDEHSWHNGNDRQGLHTT